MNENPWTYSHTQLSLFRLCPRKYFYRYILGMEEEPDIKMAFSKWMVHGVLESYLENLNNQDWGVFWETRWCNFLAELNLDSDNVPSPFSIKLSKQILDTYKATSLKGEILAVEQKEYVMVGNYRYVSKPDAVLVQQAPSDDGWTKLLKWTVDFKFSMARQVPPLLPFDDQLLGQAVTHGANGFLRVLFHMPSGKGKVQMITEGHLVDPDLVGEWKSDTISTIVEIESNKMFSLDSTPLPWPKVTGSCGAFGRSCAYIPQCKLGIKYVSFNHGHQEGQS